MVIRGPECLVDSPGKRPSHEIRAVAPHLVVLELPNGGKDSQLWEDIHLSKSKNDVAVQDLSTSPLAVGGATIDLDRALCSSCGISSSVLGGLCRQSHWNHGPRNSQTRTGKVP
jgi:hypothetical protein